MLRELDGVANEIDEHLPQPGRIADQRGGDLRSDAERQLEPLLVGANRHHLERLVEDLAEIEVDALEHQMAGLHLGKVQDVVDQVQELAPRLPEDADVLALLRGQRGFPQQVRHADDGVHRRPDLVAHAGEEVALGAVRVLGGLLGLLLDLFDTFAQGDVGEGHHRPLDVPIHPDRRPGVLGGERRSVATPQDFAVHPGPRPRAHSTVDRALLVWIRRAVRAAVVHRLVHVLAEQFFWLIAEQRGSGRVDEGAAFSQIHPVNALARRLQQGALLAREALPIPFRAAALEKLPNLAADRPQHLEQVRIGLCDLAAEELHRPENLAAQQDRES